MRMTVEIVEESVSGLGFEEGMDEYDYAMVLYASAQEGPNADRIASLLGWPRERTRAVARALRDRGLWQGTKVIHGGWDDPEHGAIAFCLDVAVAQGWLDRVETQED